MMNQFPRCPSWTAGASGRGGVYFSCFKTHGAKVLQNLTPVVSSEALLFVLTQHTYPKSFLRGRFRIRDRFLVQDFVCPVWGSFFFFFLVSFFFSPTQNLTNNIRGTKNSGEDGQLRHVPIAQHKSERRRETGGWRKSKGPEPWGVSFPTLNFV